MARSDSLLAKVPLFEGLSKKELRSLANELQEETFNAGEDIVTAGKPGGRFYLIIDGRAKVIKGDRTRNSLGPGDYFGEISIIDKGPRSATVRADTYVRALSIASWNFLSVLVGPQRPNRIRRAGCHGRSHGSPAGSSRFRGHGSQPHP
jgi:CRP/FNR family cyclic AMP-dependent transcriptional regulator